MIIDTARLGTAKPAPGGGVVVPAHIGRGGVQLYRRPDGSVVRAFRPIEEVRIADYTGAPVTIGHPDGGVGVTPANWRQSSIGAVRSQSSTLERRGAHEFVRADIQVSDADAIPRLGVDLLECSCAYTCQKDWTPGVTADGQEYDVTFRGFVPNHVALGPEGFARAGREARLVADGENEMDQLFDNTLIADDCVTPLAAPAAPATGDRDKLVADAALATAEIARLTKDLETVRGTLAAAEAKRDELKTVVDGLPKAISDGVTSELAFRQAIAAKLPKGFDFAGKSPRDVKVAAIKHATPNTMIADDASDAWLDGFLAAAPAVVEHDHNTTHGTTVADAAEESVYAKRSREAFAAGSK